MPDERGKHYEQDHIEHRGLPGERIEYIEDEAGKLFPDETNPVDKIISDWLASGRVIEVTDLKADPELGRRLAEKRAEIERDLPGLYGSMSGDPARSPRQWKYSGRVYDGQYGSMIQRPFEGEIKLTVPEGIEFPVRVGDVVRIIDTQYGFRPLPGHVVDIDGWWITVAGPLGRKQTFFGSNGYLIAEYRWRLEPYITEEENNR
jgi:hypothetical protein